ncbi:response regulator transcription factor [bacterium]|nr:response regulator transcription factor [bacterium]
MKKDTLTPRELEVLNLVIKGYYNQRISELLCISEHTTKAHLSSIYEKLQVSNRIQAIIKYIKSNKELRLTAE